MRNRLPLILSSCSLILVVLATTPLGNAANHALATVPFAKSADYAKLAGNATQLNGRKSTLSGAPGTIPVIGTNGKLPTAIGTVGPAGPQGEKGKDGKNGRNGKDGNDGRDGKAATGLWARFDTTQIIASSGKPTFTHRGEGQWDLNFGENVDKCALLATKTVSGLDPTNLNRLGIAVSASGNTVRVLTWITTGPQTSYVDIPFSLAVLC